ncbi:MAG: energy transducer TonB, partial [Candidatus Marinimicrobia bacterium]|nr:energy transducer TonB [Candidatus Neomarinimicrobiota bacterium]
MIIKKDLKVEHYPLRIRGVVAAVVLGIAVVAYVYPRFESRSALRHAKFSEVVQTFDIPQTQQFEAPPPPSRPAIPVESMDEDFAEDITIEETELDSFEDWTAPPPLSTDNKSIRFIAYDEPPQPIGGYEAMLKNLVYPDLALSAGIEGTVIVQAFVDKNGRVTETSILEGIPNTGMDEAAMTAVKRTRFKPARQRDIKLGVWLAVP